MQFSGIVIEASQIQEVQTGSTLNSGISSFENHGCGDYYLVTLDREVVLDIIIFVESLWMIYFRSYNDFFKIRPVLQLTIGSP